MAAVAPAAAVVAWAKAYAVHSDAAAAVGRCVRERMV